MKTAVSLPDDLFESVERLTRFLGVSRSELYRQALVAYIKRFDEQQITDAANAVCDSQPGGNTLDPRLERLQFASIAREEW